MDCDIFMMYVQGMNQLKNEELLGSFKTSSYPSMTPDSRKEAHRSAYKCAFPNEFNNPKNVIKLGDLSKVLK